MAATEPEPVEFDPRPTPANVLALVLEFLQGVVELPTGRRLTRLARSIRAREPDRRRRTPWAAATARAHDRALNWVGAVLHLKGMSLGGRRDGVSNAECAALFKRVSGSEFYRRYRHIPYRLLPKPHRGAAGRAAVASNAAAIAARMQDLHACGASDSAIAAWLSVSTKTVHRALKGKRLRRRTGDAARGGRGRFEGRDRNGQFKRSNCVAPMAVHSDACPDSQVNS